VAPKSRGTVRLASANPAKRPVVDSELRVNGVRNLRIADSTIMPRIVAVPTMPACVLIGLRMTELLTGDRHHRHQHSHDRSAVRG